MTYRQNQCYNGANTKAKRSIPLADYLPVSAYPEGYKQLRVDPDKPQEQLRRLDQIALEHFDGYIPMALHHVYYVGDDKELADSLIDEMTQFEARLLLEMIHQNAIRIGGKDVFSKVHKMENARARTNMTEEAIRAAEKNPFAKPFWISVGLLVGVTALFVAAAAILAKVAPGEITANIASVVVYAGMLWLLTNVVNKTRSFIAFRTAKKLLPWYDEYSKETAESKDQLIIPDLPVKLSPVEERALSKRNAIFLPLFFLLCIAILAGCFALPITGNLAWLWLAGGALLLLIILVVVIIRKGDALIAWFARRIEEKQARKK